jgi:hypothetical protein
MNPLQGYAHPFTQVENRYIHIISVINRKQTSYPEPQIYNAHYPNKKIGTTYKLQNPLLTHVCNFYAHSINISKAYKQEINVLIPKYKILNCPRSKLCPSS